jgi:hypothetical protein
MNNKVAGFSSVWSRKVRLHQLGDVWRFIVWDLPGVVAIGTWRRIFRAFSNSKAFDDLMSLVTDTS